MENPNAVIEMERDDNGNITRMSYKVYDAGEDGKRALEFLEIVSKALEAEAPEDHSTHVDVKMNFPICE